MTDNTNKLNNIIHEIRQGNLDINVQDLFLSIMIKGLLYNLKNDIKVRNIPVPHMILHTGDDRMWLETKGYDASIEPLNISNENAVYSIIPKCVVTPNGIDIDSSQLTSPYSLGTIQYTVEDGDLAGVYVLNGEFRRLPIKMSFDLKYYTDSFTDMLELIQYIMSNLAFVRTYDIVYMGQEIKCSYQIQTSFEDTHMMELDGASSDNKNHSLNISIAVESNMPIFNNKSIMQPVYISGVSQQISMNL